MATGPRLTCPTVLCHPLGPHRVAVGRARTAFPPTLAITSADAQFTGVDAGDAAGTSVQAADFDGDGVIDLAVGAPNAAGPANGRAGAGEAYVLFGNSQFGASASLASAGTTIYGAHAGDRGG